MKLDMMISGGLLWQQIERPGDAPPGRRTSRALGTPRRPASVPRLIHQQLTCTEPPVTLASAGGQRGSTSSSMLQLLERAPLTKLTFRCPQDLAQRPPTPAGWRRRHDPDRL